MYSLSSDGHLPSKHVDSELVSASRQSQTIPKTRHSQENQHDSDNIAKHLKVCDTTANLYTSTLICFQRFDIRDRPPGGVLDTSTALNSLD